MFGVNVDNKPPLPQPCAPVPPSCPPGLPRPKLRGFLTSNLKVRVVICFAFITFNTICMRAFHVNARRNRYREFYRTYDPVLDFERMKKAGTFCSMDTEGGVLNM